jgi:hypothetical protein
MFLAANLFPSRGTFGYARAVPTPLIICPVTGQRAQVWTDEDAPAIERPDTVTYVSVDCPACGGRHWVNPDSGHLLGDTAED